MATRSSKTSLPQQNITSQQHSDVKLNHSKPGLMIRVSSYIFLLATIFYVGINGPKIGVVSYHFQLYVTPPGPFFNVWIVIYTTQLLIATINLFLNRWSKSVHLLHALTNLAQNLWTFYFIKDDQSSVILASYILIPLLPITFALWREMGNKTHYGSKFVIYSRNIYAFFMGWIVAAVNLAVGILMVYSWGYSKQCQTATFWVVAPLCALGVTYFGYSGEKKRGIKCIWGCWISVVWGVLGAALNSHECISGIGIHC